MDYVPLSFQHSYLVIQASTLLLIQVDSSAAQFLSVL